jgi:hypothetical protein
MNDMIEVSIPVEPEVAKALENPARRQAAGGVLTGLLRGGHARDALTQATAEASREARANGLTDEDVDAELAAWRAERQG